MWSEDVVYFVGVKFSTLLSKTQDTFLEHLYANLGDIDVRVRLAAANALCRYASHSNATESRPLAVGTLRSSANRNRRTIYTQLVSERVFQALPPPLCDILDAATANGAAGAIAVGSAAAGTPQTLPQPKREQQQRLARVLFRLSNDLLRFGEKHQQVSASERQHRMMDCD